MWFCFSLNTLRSVSFYSNWRLLTGQVGCRIQHLSQRLTNPFFLLSKNRLDQTQLTGWCLIQVVTGNCTSRDLANNDFGIESRVQDFLLDFWRTYTFSSVKELEVTNQLRVIKTCKYQPAWDHPGVHHRQFDWGVNACVNVSHNKSIESFSHKTASISANLSGQLICLYSNLCFLTLCMQLFLLVSLSFFSLLWSFITQLSL